jgi:CheY-like chemotaxis protein
MVPILIVDDAREDLVFAQRVLSANKILNPIHLVSSGKACLDYFGGKTGGIIPQLPCILFLDMVMKPLNGIEVLRRLKNLPAAKGSILIMLSGLTDIKKIAEGYRQGASTFLIKPLVAGELLQMLKSVNGLVINKVPGGTILSIFGRHAGLAPEAPGVTQSTSFA